jgi:polyhydroxybutyrate depolymerase
LTISKRLLGCVVAAALVTASGDVAGSAAPPGPGVHTRELSWSNERRSYLLYVPATYTSEHPAPVVLNFHGNRSRAADQVALSRMNAAADAAGFVVIYPEGVGVMRWHSFNAGACCAVALERHEDDVGFAMAVVDDVGKLLRVDSAHVFATGMSNGAMMAYRLACERPDRIAAIAPVAGVLVFRGCNPARPVPVLHFHGTADRFVPYDGRPAEGTPGRAARRFRSAV